ncbi:MAG: hypothetical protein ACJ754_06295 [Pyrinomonadaceae bacterium]
MRNLLALLFAALCVCGAAGSAAAQTAREKAIIEDPKGTPHVLVNTGKNKPLSKPTGALYLVDKGERVQVTDVFSNVSSTFEEFQFNFPASLPFDPSANYEVVLTFPVKGDGGATRTILRTITVQPKLSAELQRSGSCQEGIMLVLTSNLDLHDWSAVYAWLDSFQSNPASLATVRVRAVGTDDSRERRISSINFKRRPPGNLFDVQRICLKFEEALPTKKFDAEMTLNDANRPPEVDAVVSGEGLTGRTIFAADDSLERNVDLGVTLSSSVANEDVPATASEPATTIRRRTNRGALDLKFKPWLDIVHPIIEDNKWLHYFTPFYLDANVATGKITEDTLALNRITFGFEGEARYRKTRGSEPDSDEDFRKIVTHRITYGATHASDRDFKQDEFTGKIEYKPVIWKLNSPINLNYTLNSRGEESPGKFGYSFLPTFGFEVGRTYHRNNPAPAVKPSDTVRRFYVGLDMGLDVTQHLTFGVTDTFYWRGETPNDRARNYFKGGFEAPLGELFKSAVHGFFLTFERGDLAPFATPSVNALKFGYRIQANYCAPNCR